MHRNFRFRHHDRRFAHEDAEGHGPARGGRHHHRRGGRHGRVFDQGELRYVMLHLIAEKSRHGYELIKEIEERLGGSYSPSPGVVYPTLTWLEELGYAAVAASEAGRRLYSITDDGRRFLDAHRPEVDNVLDRMKEAGAARASFQAPEIVRAMENLKLALRLRTSRGPLSPAELDTIATAIDQAARAVERS